MPNKILVALDNSALSRSVFDEALAIAQAMQAHLRVLHVVLLSKETIQDSPGHIADLNPFLFDQKEEATHEDHLLRKYVSESIHMGIHTELFQYAGDPGQIICNFALVWEADLIVMGRRGHSSLSDLLLGSVSDYVVRHAPCSVHIVHRLNHNQSRAVAISQVKVIY
jgi:nucleotide-binding universal stress UspA family protein